MPLAGPYLAAIFADREPLLVVLVSDLSEGLDNQRDTRSASRLEQFIH
jgi:hypothetical protein